MMMMMMMMYFLVYDSAEFTGSFLEDKRRAARAGPGKGAALVFGSAMSIGAFLWACELVFA